MSLFTFKIMNLKRNCTITTCSFNKQCTSVFFLYKCMYYFYFIHKMAFHFYYAHLYIFSKFVLLHYGSTRLRIVAGWLQYLKLQLRSLKIKLRNLSILYSNY